MVLTTHVSFVTGFAVTGGALGALAARMDFGVAIFFLLSGFLLYRPWVREALGTSPRPNLRRYAVRRTARLLPAYLVTLVVIFTWLPQADPSPAQWATNLTFTQVYWPGMLVEGFSQTWSLATEVSFYIALPALAWLGMRARRHPLRGHVVLVAVMAVAGVLFDVARGIGLLAHSQAGFWLPSFLLWFALGMGAALVAEAHRAGRLSPRLEWIRQLAADPITCVAVGVLLLIVLSTPIAGPYLLAQADSWAMIIKHVGYGAAALALLLPSFLAGSRTPPDLVSAALTSPGMAWLGRISYGVFLWHLGCMWTLMNLVGIEPFTGSFLLLLMGTAALTCVVAAISWYVLEWPILRLAHRR